MRTCVSTKGGRWLMGSLMATSVVLAPAAYEPAAAGPKLRSINVGAAARAATRPEPDEKQVASAESKPNDPLANLNVSARTKAHQERADRILAENGETRIGDDATDETSASETAPGAAAPVAKPKSATAGMQCIAGCY